MVGLGVHTRQPALLHTFWQLFRADTGHFHLCVRVGAWRSQRHAEDRSNIGCRCDRIWRRIVFVPASSPDAIADMERLVIATALTDLWYGFGVAVQPHNIMWCFIGVLGRQHGRRAAGHGPSRDNFDSAAADIRHQTGWSNSDARGRDVWRAIWRGHLLHLAQSAVSPAARCDMP